jgi:hypothetical protein
MAMILPVFPMVVAIGLWNPLDLAALVVVLRISRHRYGGLVYISGSYLKRSGKFKNRGI